MAGKLNAANVKALGPGRHPDGDRSGLYLVVKPGGTGRAWEYRYTLHGRARLMGLGSTRDVSLAEAREAAAAARKLVRQGVDPIDRRRDERELAEGARHTFRDTAAAYIEAHAARWSNGKHRGQWTATLTTYAYPVLGSLPVGRVDLSHVLEVLKPIWAGKPETASRVRGRIEAVLDYASVRGWRTQPLNPARWKGNLDKLLPARAAVRRVQHHAALPYSAMPDFMAELRGQPGIAARALEFAILTAARTSEVTGATWRECDLDAGVWTVPADRMKARREHRVPLSNPAAAILRELAATCADPTAHVFPGGRIGRGLSNMALLALLRRMGRTDLTAHGFRSSFRDWCSERTGYPAEVAEAALAHAVPDKTEAAYRRGDLMAKRRRLMADWGRFCMAPPPAGVVALRRKAGT